MHGRVRQISPDELSRFQSDPDSLEQFLCGEIEANAPKIRAALQRVQEIGRKAIARGPVTDAAENEKVRAAILKELISAGARLPVQSSDDGLGLEKSWHVLHYLLTGKTEAAPPPLGNAIMGGEEIGEQRDYGRIRFLTPQQVREVAKALAKVSREDLAARFDPKGMKAAEVIYPCRDQEELDIALDHFGQLVDYYSDAATGGNAMLLYIE